MGICFSLCADDDQQDNQGGSTPLKRVLMVGGNYNMDAGGYQGNGAGPATHRTDRQNKRSNPR